MYLIKYNFFTQSKSLIKKIFNAVFLCVFLKVSQIFQEPVLFVI